MEKTIEYLQIKMGNGNNSAHKTKVAKAELLDIITNPDFQGSHFLVNIQSLPEIRAFLLIDTGLLTDSIIKADNPDNPTVNSAPVLFYPLGASAKNGNGANSKSESNQPSSKSNGENMTVAQRRYIFRLVSEKKKLKGKEIEEYLKKRFNVQDIEDIDKGSASQLIDGLINGGA